MFILLRKHEGTPFLGKVTEHGSVRRIETQYGVIHGSTKRPITAETKKAWVQKLKVPKPLRPRAPGLECDHIVLIPSRITHWLPKLYGSLRHEDSILFGCDCACCQNNRTVFESLHRDPGEHRAVQFSDLIDQWIKWDEEGEGIRYWNWASNVFDSGKVIYFPRPKTNGFPSRRTSSRQGPLKAAVRLLTGGLLWSSNVHPAIRLDIFNRLVKSLTSERPGPIDFTKPPR